MEITIADAPESTSSDLKDDSFNATSTPAYFNSCTIIGFFGGFVLDSFHISSTRSESYKYTSPWFLLEMASLSSSVASEEKGNCFLHNMEENLLSGT